MNNKWFWTVYSVFAVIVAIIAVVAGFRMRTDSEVKELEELNVPNLEVETIQDVHLLQEEVEEDSLAYTEKELEILAIIIYQEAGSDRCSDDTRLKVGNVFLNRINSPSFPNTFEEVATGEGQYGRLHWTGIVWPDRASSPGERHAVERAYNIAQQLLEGKRVLPSNVIWQAEFPQGDGVHRYQDGIYFCYTEVK